jgi:hypothetical protein
MINIIFLSSISCPDVLWRYCERWTYQWKLSHLFFLSKYHPHPDSYFLTQMYDVSIYLVNPLNNCICLGISCYYWYSIILFYHCLEKVDNERTNSVVGYLGWQWISRKPFSLSYVSQCALCWEDNRNLWSILDYFYNWILYAKQGCNKIQIFETLSCLSKQGSNMI